jgi:hypothetical protein
MARDFNLIYKTADKNNSHLDRSLMSSFRQCIHDLELEELHLQGVGKMCCNIGTLGAHR